MTLLIVIGVLLALGELAVGVHTWRLRRELRADLKRLRADRLEQA